MKLVRSGVATLYGYNLNLIQLIYRLIVLSSTNTINRVFWLLKKISISSLILFTALREENATIVDRDVVAQLLARIEANEKIIDELKNRVSKLEVELYNHSLSARYDTASNVSTTASVDHDTPGGGEENGFSVIQSGSAQPPPPPPPPPPSSFHFTSTPNPVFLSCPGKVHPKKLSKFSEFQQQHKQEQEKDSFIKRKRQRVLQEELIQQKKLLRKITKVIDRLNSILYNRDLLASPSTTTTTTVIGPKSGRSIEPQFDVSLNDMMATALKRKFANVTEVPSLNDSAASEETYGEFSL